MKKITKTKPLPRYATADFVPPLDLSEDEKVVRLIATAMGYCLMYWYNSFKIKP